MPETVGFPTTSVLFLLPPVPDLMDSITAFVLATPLWNQTELEEQKRETIQCEDVRKR